MTHAGENLFQHAVCYTASQKRRRFGEDPVRSIGLSAAERAGGGRDFRAVAGRVGEKEPRLSARQDGERAGQKQERLRFRCESGRGLLDGSKDAGVIQKARAIANCSHDLPDIVDSPHVGIRAAGIVDGGENPLLEKPKEPTIWPASLIPVASVRSAPGTSRVVKAPFE